MRHLYSGMRLGVAMLSLGVELGCRGDTTGPASIDPAHLYWRLVMNHHAITMALTAPYNTIQLMATPQSATGVPLADTNTTTYIVSDTSVTVSPTGLLTAIAPAARVKVIAIHTMGTVTLADTATINVNAAIPTSIFTTLRLRGQPGDSARSTYAGALFFATVVADVLDAQGNPIQDVVVKYTSSDINIADAFLLNVGINVLNMRHPGRVMLYAEATVYGVRKIDSVLYSVGLPLVAIVSVLPRTVAGSLVPNGYFSPHDDTVAVGATITWLSQQLPADVVFDNPAAVQKVDSADYAQYYTHYYIFSSAAAGEGNISVFTPQRVTVIDTSIGPDCECILGIDTTVTLVNNVRARKFMTAGTYPYHSAQYGTTGVIHVLPEFQLP